MNNIFKRNFHKICVEMREKLIFVQLKMISRIFQLRRKEIMGERVNEQSKFCNFDDLLFISFWIIKNQY